MEKKYRYIIECEEFVAGSGFRNHCVMDDDYTIVPEWSVDEFCSYILDGCTEDDLLQIIRDDKVYGIDYKYTYSTYRADYDAMFDDDEPLYTVCVWKSDAAKKIIGKDKLREEGYEIDD